MAQSAVVGTSGYAANSRTAQINPPSFHIKAFAPMAPGTISAVKFVSGGISNVVPSQGSGIHFHAYSSGNLLDFVTPSQTSTSKEWSLSALDLGTLRWQKLAEGRDIFKPGYRWHYCTMNEDGTKVWLLGCPTDPGVHDLGGNMEEYLSDVMEVDLRRYGFLGNSMAPEPRNELTRPLIRPRQPDPPSKGLGSDLARLFNQPPESGSGTDFTVTTMSANGNDEDMLTSALVLEHDSSCGAFWPDLEDPKPIHVHRLILQARWPHFARLWGSGMIERKTNNLHLPEPYSVVKAFLYYLYTDRIDSPPASYAVDADEGLVTDLSDIAGLLVMSNIYNIPHLRLLCVNRLSKELDVDHACVIWYCAGLAHEEWLRRRAAGFCLTHWGRIVRTSGFSKLPRKAMVELSQEIDMDGRVIGGEEVDMYGSAYDARYGDGGRSRRKESTSTDQSAMAESEADDEDEGMEMS